MSTPTENARLNEANLALFRFFDATERGYQPTRIHLETAMMCYIHTPMSDGLHDLMFDHLDEEDLSGMPAEERERHEERRRAQRTWAAEHFTWWPFLEALRSFKDTLEGPRQLGRKWPVQHEVDPQLMKQKLDTLRETTEKVDKNPQSQPLFKTHAHTLVKVLEDQAQRTKFRFDFHGIPVPGLSQPMPAPQSSESFLLSGATRHHHQTTNAAFRPASPHRDGHGTVANYGQLQTAYRQQGSGHR